MFTRPKSSGDQFHDATKRNKWSHAGHLDGNLLGVTDKDEATSAQIQLGSFSLLGLISGELCFSYIASSQQFDKGLEPIVEGRRQFMERSIWIFEAHDSPATIKDGWPEHAKTHVTRTTVQSKRRKDAGWFNSRHEWNAAWRLESRIENCGPAPRVTPATKYITISRFGGDKPALLVWKLDAPPSSDFLASAATIEADPAMPKPPGIAPDPAPAEPPSGEGFVAGPKSIMETLADAGDYGQFIGLLRDTGLDKELATGGPYMVMAISDRALGKVKDKSIFKDKARLGPLLRDLVFVGAVGEGTHKLKTLAGTDAEIDLRKDGRLKRRGHANVDRLGPATNAMIYKQD